MRRKKLKFVITAIVSLLLITALVGCGKNSDILDVTEELSTESTTVDEEDTSKVYTEEDYLRMIEEYDPEAAETYEAGSDIYDWYEETEEYEFDPVTIADTEDYFIEITGMDPDSNYAFMFYAHVVNRTDTESHYRVMGTINGKEYTFNYAMGSTKFLDGGKEETYVVYLDDPNFIGTDVSEITDVTVYFFINGETYTDSVSIYPN